MGKEKEKMEEEKCDYKFCLGFKIGFRMRQKWDNFLPIIIQYSTNYWLNMGLLLICECVNIDKFFIEIIINFINN